MHKSNEMRINVQDKDSGAITLSSRPEYLGHNTFLPYLLNQTTAALNADFQLVLRSYGMTLLHWRVLAYLYEADGLGISALGRVTNVDQATLSRALTVMQKAGYLARVPGMIDKRLVGIKILPAGCELFERVLPRAWDIYLRAVEGLSAEEQKTLHYLLAKIRANCSPPAESVTEVI